MTKHHLNLMVNLSIFLPQIEKLSELKDKGIITEDEFISKKEKLLTKI